MKQLLYVYVPGFEYDSKGPLHIDAIRLDVTIGELEKDDKDVVQNPLRTYVYIAPINSSTGTSPKYIEGNVIYKYVPFSDVSGYISSKYTGDAAISPLYTNEQSDRCVHGYFYDFITTPEDAEQTHHIIGIHNSIKACQNVSNLNSLEHDGLFAVEIEELNTDMVFTFTFYSRINRNNNIDIGYPESISKMTPVIDLSFFNLNGNREIAFLLEYVEIGKWIQSYNPATSGVEEGALERAEDRGLYFDLKTWGETEKYWELPVNRGLLVTDMSDEANNLAVQGSIKFWKLFSYDNDSTSPTYRKHVLNNSLACNTKSYSTYGEFYANFYEGMQRTTNVSSSGSISASDIGWAIFATEKSSLYYGERIVAGRNCSSTASGEVTFSYPITYVNLNNLNYLYSNQPKVSVINLLRDTVTNNPTATPIFMSLDMAGKSRDGSDITDQFSGYGGVNILDRYNYDGDNGGGEFLYYHRNVNTGSYKASLSLSCQQKLPIDSSYKNILLNSGKVSVFYYTGVSSGSTWTNKVAEIYFKKYYNSRSTRSSANVKCFYLGEVYDNKSTLSCRLSSESFLSPGETEVLLKLDSAYTNNISVKIKTTGAEFPVICMRQDTYRDGDTYELMDDYLKGSMPSISGSTYQKWLSLYYAGAINVGINLVFLIDLNKCRDTIQYPNIITHRVYPMLFNNKNGYWGKKLHAINLKQTNEGEWINLLDPSPSTSEPILNSSDASDYELGRILPSLVLVTTTLKYKNSVGTGTRNFYDSTFCNERRFIGANKDTGLTFSNISLTSRMRDLTLLRGLYVLKLQNMYPNRSGGTGFKLKYKINGGETQNSGVYGQNNKWIFWIENSCEFSLLEIYRDSKYWTNSSGTQDILSGIGLYEVDLSLKDTNTLILNAAVEGLSKVGKGNGFMIPVGTESIYDLVIFPAAFCAKEDIKFCDRTSYTSIGYKSDYKNDYCSSENDDPIYHYYNFKYLPPLAVYEVLAFYKIPIDKSKVDISVSGSVESVNSKLGTSDLTFLGSEVVRL